MVLKKALRLAVVLLTVLFLLLFSNIMVTQRKIKGLELATHINEEQEVNDISILQERLLFAEKQLVRLSANKSSPWTNNNNKLSDSTQYTAFNQLPHIGSNTPLIYPRIRIASNTSTSPRTIVVGIPSVKREKGSYLLDTLQSLLDNLSPAEENDIVIVVMLAEMSDMAWCNETINRIKARFSPQINAGMVEIIVPKAELYPDLEKLKLTLGDPLTRVKWRSKQTLDFAYLMNYAMDKALYYLQLEDDVVTKPNYVSSIKKCISQKLTKKWIMLEFSYLGFIGKLFKTQDLPTLVNFFVSFYDTKPVDWLLSNFVLVMACTQGTEKSCGKSVRNVSIRFKPSLFQHIGTHSSLSGKVQKLKDKDFGNVKSSHGKESHVIAHKNPKASNLFTTLKVYEKHDLKSLYAGTNVFWAEQPSANDFVSVQFEQPQRLQSVAISSADEDNANDKIRNAVLEACYLQKCRENQFQAIGSFNEDGGISAVIGKQEEGNMVHSLRIRFLSPSDYWILIKEIWIKTLP